VLLFKLVNAVLQRLHRDLQCANVRRMATDELGHRFGPTVKRGEQFGFEFFELL